MIGVALLYVDLDRFEALSETQGHHVAEQVLIQAARRLSSTVRETDTVARVGRDEFVIVQSLTEQPADTAALAGSNRSREWHCRSRSTISQSSLPRAWA